jgi:RNA polymerase sigma-70 factor (ECF subfamily)
MSEKLKETVDQFQLYAEFEEKALPHIDPLYNFALRMIGQKRKAVRLLKKTYSKAFWFYHWLEKDTDHKGWLFRVMRNAYLDKYKKNFIVLDKFNFEAVENSYEQIKPAAEISNLKNEMFSKITAVKLAKLLQLLPEELKTVIVLCDIQNFNHEEIADFVDVPVGVVQSRLYKGRKMLLIELYKLIRVDKN